MLALQRSAGNRAVGQLLARETATKQKTGLQRLDELLDKFNVDEDAVIAHLATLSEPEKAIVLRDYRARIADPLNPREMVRAIKTFNASLWNKLVWVGAAGTPDYGDIRKLITDTTDQKERDALNTKEWRSWFISVCSNATMKQAVVDLKFDLLTQLGVGLARDVHQLRRHPRALQGQDGHRRRPHGGSRPRNGATGSSTSAPTRRCATRSST